MILGFQAQNADFFVAGTVLLSCSAVDLRSFNSEVREFTPKDEVHMGLVFGTHFSGLGKGLADVLSGLIQERHTVDFSEGLLRVVQAQTQSPSKCLRAEDFRLVPVL